ncbi:restriction endonuclease [Rhodanobacter sp. FW510-R12]|uniref:restriction endonuclease n=1 Tax=unclassified Rhodanobacter TaxID=2621553 RepID=UPI0007AA295E|nr:MULTISPECIES: restriction endonuclease [unclassified Rhodanobacter]KZC16132.1 restriction endonuclease [Rhodanobacter sp. FW104-R8]KZC26426.1 restriction endonuclease [Rhodanobacter sp. FW510-T8]KZC31184.1 restriction endonuclease [Rhodanobacter sp. FW510-R10]
MARRKESGIEVVASMPWPVGIVLGLIGYIAIRYGIGWLLGTSSNPYLSGMGKFTATGAYAPLAWFVLVLCWIGALISFLGQRKRRHLLNTQTGLDSLRAMSWRQFEMLVGEAFRRRGYAIQETGLGGADGGIDLILRKGGKTTLVQCKQWKTQRVDVKVVREMFGLLAHHGAAAVKIVAVGDYTADAQRFAQGKPIELIHGEALLAMVREGQTPTSAKTTKATIRPDVTTKPDPAPSSNPICPKCGADMVQRSNRQTKDHFWGCVKYPTCRGTRVAPKGPEEINSV